MLIKYKKAHQKVAMGLLSLVVSKKNIQNLQELIRTYEERPEWQLYLWKEGGNSTGLIGVEVRDGYFVILHLSVNPSFPGEETSYQMIESVQQLLRGQDMKLSRETALFLAKCRNMSEDILPYKEDLVI